MMKKYLKKTWIGPLQFILATPLFFCASLWAEVQFQSKVETVHLVELYTSEGCYSCPPADRWLSNLDGKTGLFTDFVPLAFHVDYWNYLGWRDTYSEAEYSKRQRRYHRLGQVSGVYTPGMFLDGHEWRAWRKNNYRSINAKSASEQVGILNVTYDQGKAAFVFTPTANDQSVGKAYIALLGAGIEADIPAGENKGKTLDHDFVVLDLQQLKLSKNEEGQFVANLPNLKSDLTAPRYALAAWVTNANDSAPIQAAGTWIDKP